MKHPLIALGLVGACALAGCSGSDTTAASKSDAKRHQTATTTTAPAFVANTKNTPGTMKDFVGAHTDVSDTKCVASGKGWVATGKVKNPTKDKVQYRIYVSFLDSDTTVGVAESDVKTGAGASTNWNATVGAAGNDLRCVLRVERATV